MALSIDFICCRYNKERFENWLRPSVLSQEGDVALITVDNSQNRIGVPAALNWGWRRASRDICVFAHEDIRFGRGWTKKLLSQIELVEKSDPNWAVLGVAGMSSQGRGVFRVRDPGGGWIQGQAPAEVQTLDECCLVVKRSLPLRFDERFRLHFYGADLCLRARLAGRRCYVVDCFVVHASRGSRDVQYTRERRTLVDECMRHRREVGRRIYTTTGYIALDGSRHKVWAL